MSTRLFPDRRLLWLPLDYEWSPPVVSAAHCCSEMAMALEHGCEQHADPFECPDTVIVFHDVFGEYGLPIRDGGTSYLVIAHCPFCGSKLPDSARDRWFDAIDAAGLGDTPFADLPERYRTARWRIA